MMYNIFFAPSYFSPFWLVCELVGLSFFSAICSQGHTGAANEQTCNHTNSFGKFTGIYKQQDGRPNKKFLGVSA